MTVTQPEPATSREFESEPAEEAETGPLRRCLVTRQHHARETMLRFVMAPDGALVFDAAATLPGRGMWLSASADVIIMAGKQNLFSRAAKQRVTVPENLVGVVVFALRRRIAELLGLARRGGGAIAGFETAREWLVAGKAGLVVQAADGSAEERARFIGNRDIPVVAPLAAVELGKVFGRDHAVHVVIAAGKLARMIEVEAMRLAGVAGESPSGHIAPLRDGPD